jgi:NitT/TauT family transport system substrate-binding protein
MTVRLPSMLVAVGFLLAACAPGGAAPSASAPAAATAAPARAAPTSGPAPAAAAPVERQVIRYGHNPILAGAPLYLALERGYFVEQGFDVELTPFDSGALMIAPASAGQLEVITGVASPSLFNALARDVGLKGIAAVSYSETTLVVRKELVDSGQVKTLADLKGRRVSFNVEGSPVDYQLRNTFFKEGLTLQDVDVLRVSNTDTGAALSNGAIDAGVASDPLPVLIENRGIGVRFLSTKDYIGRQIGGILVVGPSMLSRGDATNTRFLVGFLKGVRDYLAAIHADRVTDPAALENISKWTNVPADVIAQVSTPGSEPNGRIDLPELIRQQDFWEREGLVPTKADLAQFVETRYLEAALQQVR